MQTPKLLSRRTFLRRGASALVPGAAALASAQLLTGCGHVSEPELTARTQIFLMDWHISGLWVINCPVAWIKVKNYNPVPIHDIKLRYETFDTHGRPLDSGEFTIEGTVPACYGTIPGTKDFIELYLGLVDLYSERLSCKLISVRSASE